MIEKLYFGLMNVLTRGHYAVRPPRLDLEPLEQVLLERVLSALPEAGRSILERQMAALNLVQRDGNYQKTVFYRIDVAKTASLMICGSHDGPKTHALRI